MGFRLTPRTDDLFAELFLVSGRLLIDGARLLTEVLATDAESRPRLVAQMRELEHRADETTHAIVARVNEAFVTPHDRDDLHTLAARLDDCMDHMDRAADLLAVYERQLELAQDYRERVKILFRSATIWEERFNNLPNADACVDAALSIDPQNLQAIRSLERLRKAQGRWEELVDVMDRHLALLTQAPEKAELCVEVGDVYHQQLKAVDRAVTAYHQALEFDPQCRPAMHALGTLYERSGNWPFALEMLEREARTLGTTAEAVELWYRMGKINEDMLIDGASARRCFQEALRVDPAYLPAIRSLKGLYEADQDWESYERALVDETVRDFGRLDILVNCAGVLGREEGFLERDDAEWHRVIDINLHGTYHACRAALPARSRPPHAPRSSSTTAPAWSCSRRIPTSASRRRR